MHKAGPGMNSNPNPYIGPRTFKEEERDLFYGREREASELLARVLSEQEILFYAQSGAGKSSLINTSLIPDLKKKNFEVLMGRVGGDARLGLDVDNIFVFNLLRSLSNSDVDEATLAKRSLRDFLVPEGPSAKRRALIIDQFEEIFSTHHEAWEQRGPFFAQLAQVLEADPRLRVIVVMREDYIAALDPYASILPNQFRMRYYMQRLEHAAALKAVKQPVLAKEFVRPYESGAAEKLVDDLRAINVIGPDGTPHIGQGQFVEPLYLQVICYELWNNLPPGGTTITMQNVQDVGDVSTSLGNYYARRVAAVAEAQNVTEGKIRRWFTEELISSTGIRTMVLEEPGETSAHLENKVIRALSDLIRAEQRGGAVFYELTHDRLVEPITANNKKWEAENSSPFRSQAVAWKEGKGDEIPLLSDQALSFAEQWANEHQDILTNLEAEYLRVSRIRQQEMDEERERETQRQREEQEREFQRQKEEQDRRLHQQELEAAQRLAQQQALSARRARVLTRIAVFFLVLALVASGFALRGTIQANRSRAVAEDLGDTALAGRLAGLVLGRTENRLDLSILLSIDAYNRKKDNFDARSALFANFQNTSRLHRFLNASETPVQNVHFSPDGQTIALQREQEIELWDAASLTTKTSMSSSSSAQVFFSPDNKILALLDQNTIDLWDIEDIRRINTVPINYHAGAVTQFITSSDDKTLAAVGEGGQIILWDMEKRSKIDASLPNAESVVFAPDGNTFVAIQDGTAEVWSVTKGAMISGGIQGISNVIYNPNGQQLVFVGEDGINFLWDLATAARVGETFEGSNIIFSPTGDTLISTNPDGGIVLRNTLSAEPLGNVIYTIRFAFNAAGTILAAVDRTSGYLYFWDTATGKTNPDLGNRSVGIDVGKFFFSQDDRYLAFSSYYNGVMILDLKNHAQQINQPLYNETVQAISPDGRILVTKDSAGKTVVRALDGQSATTVDLLGTDFQGFTPDGKFLIAFDSTSNVVLWDTTTWIRVDVALQGNQAIFSPEGKTMAVLNEGQSVQLWDATSYTRIGKPIKIADGSLISAINFSRAGKLVLVGGINGTVAFFNTADGNPYSEPLATGFKGKISNLLFSSDGATLVSVAESSVIYMDTATQIISKQIKGPVVGFDAAAGLVAVSNGDGTIILREVSDGKQVGKPFKGEQAVIDPDGKWLVSISVDTFTLTKIPPADAMGPSLNGKFDRFSPAGKFFSFYRTDLYGEAYEIRNIQTNAQMLVAAGSEPVFSPDEKAIYYDDKGSAYLRNLTTNSDVFLGENVQSAVFSQDGKILAIGKADGTISFWNVEKARLLGDPVVAHSEAIKDLKLSPDGDTLISVGSDGSVVVWNMTGPSTPGKSIYESPARVSSAAASQDGKTFAVFVNNSIVLRNIDNEISKPFNGHLAEVASVAVSPDETVLAAATSDGRLILYSLLTGERIVQLPDDVFQVFSPNSKSLLVKSKEAVFMLLDAQSGARYDAFHAEGNIPFYSYDGNFIWTQNNEGGYRIFDITRGTEIEIEGATVFSPDERWLVTSVSDTVGKSNAVIWDTRTWTKHDTLPGDFLQFSPDGTRLIYKTDVGSGLWDVAAGKTIGEPVSSDYWGFTQDSKIWYTTKIMSVSLAGGGCSCTTALWDSSTGDLIADSIEGEMERPGTEDIPFLLHNSLEGYYYLWDLQKKDRVQEDLVIRAERAFTSPDARYLVSIYEGMYSIWNSHSGKMIKERPRLEPETWLGFSPDGQSYLTSISACFECIDLNTGSRVELDSLPGIGPTTAQKIIEYREQNGPFAATEEIINVTGIGPATYERIKDLITVSVAENTQQSVVNQWDLATGEMINTMTGSKVSVSPGYRFVVVSGEDGNLTVWNVSNGDHQTFPGVNPDSSNSMNFSPEGNLLTLYGKGGIAIINLSEMQMSRSFQDKSGIVTSLKFSRDGQLLASLGSDGIIVWDARSYLNLNHSPLKPEQGEVLSMGFRVNKEGINELIFIADDGKIYTWSSNNDVGQTGEEIKNPAVCALALNPAGTQVAYHRGNKIFIHAIGTDSDENLEETETSCFGAMAFSKDGKVLAYSDAGKITILDVQDRKTIAELDGSGTFKQLVGLNFIQYDDNLKILAAQSDDGYISLWNIDEHSLIGRRFAGDFQGLDSNIVFAYRDPADRFVVLDFSTLPALLNTWKDELCAKVSGRFFTLAEYQRYLPGLSYDDYIKQGGTCFSVIPVSTP